MNKTPKSKQNADGGSMMRLVSICESCYWYVPALPCFEDPLATPYCAKEHWVGYIVEAPPEEDPWKDCPDFTANHKDQERTASPASDCSEI